MNLRPDTLLKRANGITINIDSLHTVEITVNNQKASFTNQALSILSAFAQPLTMSEGLGKMQVSGVQNWVEISGTISKLWMIGALCNYDENQFAPDKNFASFGSAPIHIAMLNDRIRTDKFAEGIKDVIKEGDVVVDIGTGTGVLAIAAAKAGAAKVYAVEAGAIADVAQGVIDGTAYQDKITLIRGWSTHVELPEKADVLVSEIIGNDPFDENVLQVFIDARKRLLKPGARMVPNSIKVMGLPVHIPAALLQDRILQDHDLKNWREWYDCDFSALGNINADLSRFLIRVNGEKVRELTVYDEPLVLAEVNFETFSESKIENYVHGKAKQSFNGLLVYFELGLGNTTLSNHPGHSERSNHWLNFVWYLPDAEALEKDDDYTLYYKYAGGRDSEIKLVCKNQTGK